MKKCIIIAGGELDVQPNTSECDMLICADSGYSHAEKFGITPDVIIGDFDSFTGQLPADVEVIRSAPEKDDTDTLMAVKLAIARGAQDITLYGGFGGRFDHTFANLQAMKFALNNRIRMRIADRNNVAELFEEGIHIFKRRGAYFSVFAYSDKAYIEKLSGVKYPLRNAILTNGVPLGVSNEIVHEQAFLEISSGTVLVINSTFAGEKSSQNR